MGYLPLGDALTDLINSVNVTPTLSTTERRATPDIFSRPVSNVSVASIANSAVKALAKKAAQDAANRAKAEAQAARQRAEAQKRADQAAQKAAKQKADAERKAQEQKAKAEKKAADEKRKADKKAADQAAYMQKVKDKAARDAANRAADQLKQTDFDLDPIGPVPEAGQPMTLKPDTSQADAAASAIADLRAQLAAQAQAQQSPYGAGPVYTTPQGGEVYDSSFQPGGSAAQGLPEITSTAPAPSTASFGIIGALVLIGLVLGSRKAAR